MTNEQCTTVLIVDDQAMVREGFGALLAAQPDIDVVGDAPDGQAAIDASRRLGTPSWRRPSPAL